MSAVQTLPGDIVLTRGTSWLSKAIRWFTRARGEARTWTNHAGIITTPGNILEAKRRVIEHPLSDLEPGTYQVWRFGRNIYLDLRLAGLVNVDDEDFSTDMRESVAWAAGRYKGQPYGYLKIFAHAVDGLLSKVFGRNVYQARRLAGMDNYPICSWVVAWAYCTALDYTFGVPPQAASPDDIHDWVKRHSDHWRRVL